MLSGHLSRLELQLDAGEDFVQGVWLRSIGRRPVKVAGEEHCDPEVRLEAAAKIEGELLRQLGTYVPAAADRVGLVRPQVAGGSDAGQAMTDWIFVFRLDGQ